MHFFKQIWIFNQICTCTIPWKDDYVHHISELTTIIQKLLESNYILECVKMNLLMYFVCYINGVGIVILWMIRFVLLNDCCSFCFCYMNSVCIGVLRKIFFVLFYEQFMYSNTLNDIICLMYLPLDDIFGYKMII